LDTFLEMTEEGIPGEVQEPLLVEEPRKNKGRSSGALICAKVAIAFLSIFLFIAVLALLIIILEPLVLYAVPLYSYTTYTAEYEMVYVDGDNTTQPRKMQGREVVFESNRWYEEVFVNDTLMTRTFVDNQDMCTSCKHVGSHDNCYVYTCSPSRSLYVPRASMKVYSRGACPSYASVLGRKVEKCDLYSFSVRRRIVNDFLDSETHLPVMMQLIDTSSTSTGLSIIEMYYKSFSQINQLMRVA